MRISLAQVELVNYVQVWRFHERSLSLAPDDLRGAGTMQKRRKNDAQQKKNILNKITQYIS